jgi:lipoprotein-anchoring transpeptidase ErfK/SrfK
MSTVAEAVPPSIGIYERPGAAEPRQILANPQDWGVPQVFLVKEQQPDWLAVDLPVRPNGSTGWVRRSDITLTTHEYRIVVELGERRLTVWHRDSVFLQESVGVGSRATPTPGGVYYTRALLQPRDDDTGLPDTGGPYGPYAFVLSGFSEVLYDFAGGNGELGIHGTNDARSLGRNGGHGCIRMSNEAISKLAGTLPLGVPVEVRP